MIKIARSIYCCQAFELHCSVYRIKLSDSNEFYLTLDNEDVEIYHCPFCGKELKATINLLKKLSEAPQEDR